MASTSNIRNAALRSVKLNITEGYLKVTVPEGCYASVTRVAGDEMIEFEMVGSKLFEVKSISSDTEGGYFFIYRIDNNYYLYKSDGTYYLNYTYSNNNCPEISSVSSVPNSENKEEYKIYINQLWFANSDIHANNIECSSLSVAGDVSVNKLTAKSADFEDDSDIVINNSVTVNGNITAGTVNANNISSTSITASDIEISNQAQINGNLSVSDKLEVKDLNATINSATVKLGNWTLTKSESDNSKINITYNV